MITAYASTIRGPMLDKTGGLLNGAAHSSRMQPRYMLWQAPELLGTIEEFSSLRTRCGDSVPERGASNCLVRRKSILRQRNP